MIEVWRGDEKVAAGAITSITATGDEWMVVFFGSGHLDLSRKDAEQIAAAVAEIQW